MTLPRRNDDDRDSRRKPPSLPDYAGRPASLAPLSAASTAAPRAARCFFSKLLDALGAQPDSSFNLLDPALRDALTVGRPVAIADDGRSG
jgi:hypothetical protein